MRAIVLIDNEFEDSELIYPYYRLQEVGYKVDLAGPEKGKIYKSKHGYPMKSDKAAKDTKIGGYAVLIIPGGYAPDHMRTNKAMVDLVRAASKRNRRIGAICHGAQMLIEADILKGKKATCYKAVRTDLINAGAKYQDKEVVVDKNLVTSRFPPDLPAFMKAILAK